MVGGLKKYQARPNIEQFIKYSHVANKTNHVCGQSIENNFRFLDPCKLRYRQAALKQDE